MNREEILRKLPRTISQQSANVSINEAFTYMSGQNRDEKVGRGRGRGKKMPSGTEYLRRRSSHNHGHNILRLFDVLPNFLFTTSETNE